MRATCFLTGLLAAGLALACSAAELAPAGGADVAAAPATGLTVKVSGLRNSQGQLAVLVFDGAEGFPGDHRRAVRQAFIGLRDADGKPRPESALSATFADLPSGSYAVSVLHDEDGDRRMRTGLFGIPREGIGASNNPAMRFGPPSFGDAKVEIDEGGLSLSISVLYF